MNINFDLQHIYQKLDFSQKKTKIIATMGPACTQHETLVGMLQKGMNIARLNFSHGDHVSHKDTLEKVRAASKEAGTLCAILLDTKGPEIRTGMLEDQKNITLVRNQTLEISKIFYSATDYTILGNSQRISCSYADLPYSIQVGKQILIADGSLVCEVLEIRTTSVIVKVLNDCSIGERKNMNLPGCEVKLPTVTEKDQNDIVNFGLKNNIDMIALSFTRTGDDIKTVRKLLGPQGQYIKIIAKIENQEGLNNFEDILEHADGIMVARGDLGMEIPTYKVFLAQKWMIQQCNKKGKPVITATQMMESIIKNPRPTRAEASDVANAVLDGSDVVMLSGETANGVYPLVAVEMMAQICCEAENCINYNKLFELMRQGQESHLQKEALAISAVQLSFAIQAPLIITLTASGEGVRLMAKYRPQAQILALCLDDRLSKSLQLVRGVSCLKVQSFYIIEDLILMAIKQGKQTGELKEGQHIVVVYSKNDESSNNIVRVQEVL